MTIQLGGDVKDNSLQAREGHLRELLSPMAIASTQQTANSNPAAPVNLLCSRGVKASL